MKSGNPFVIEAQDVLAHNMSTSTLKLGFMLRGKNIGRKTPYENTLRLHAFVTDVGPIPTGNEFDRSAWVRLNRYCSGIERFRSLMLNR